MGEMNLFEKLIVLHLLGDWVLQPHSMAIRKTSDPTVRFIHSFIVTVVFVNLLNFWWLLYIFATHFIIDSYKPLFYLRKLRGDFTTLEEFKESFNTPAGFVVNVALDQIFHIFAFIPIVFFASKV
jgi:hypothetical protein